MADQSLFTGSHAESHAGAEEHRTDRRAGRSAKDGIQLGALGPHGRIDRLITAAGETYALIRTDHGERELWRSDGSAEGTMILRDHLLDLNGTDAELLAGIVGKQREPENAEGQTSPPERPDPDARVLLTVGTPRTGWQLWASDGRVQGTTLIRTIASGRNETQLSAMVRWNGQSYVVSSTRQTHRLWKSDGSSAGTAVIAVIETATGGDEPVDLIPTADALSIRIQRPQPDQTRRGADAATNAGVEVWTSDGTPEGTVRRRLEPQPAESLLAAIGSAGGSKGPRLDAVVASIRAKLTGGAGTIANNPRAEAGIRREAGVSTTPEPARALPDQPIQTTNVSPLFTVAADSAQVLEGNSGSTTVRFTVSLSEVVNGPTSVNWTVQGSGTSPASAADFTANGFASGTLNFEAGQISQSLDIQVAGDSAYEADETFELVLSNPTGAALGTPSAAGVTLSNDDTGLTITADQAGKPEGNSGSTSYSFIVSRLGNSSGTSSVQWEVSGSSAASASDFSGGSYPGGTLYFGADATSKTITVNVSGDYTVEPDESFNITLSNASGAEIVTSSASSTIGNDDTSYSISADAAVKAEGNSGYTPFQFTVKRNGVASGSGSVYWYAYGSGSNPATTQDVDPSSVVYGTMGYGQLIFNTNETQKTITINVKGDTDIEFDESFQVYLYSPSGGLVDSTASSATATIDDDDFIGISLSLPGNGLLRFALPTNDPILTSFASKGLSDLINQEATSVSLYGLSDVKLKITAVANGVATISGSGKLAGKSVDFIGQLSASGNSLYSLSNISGSVDLSQWLGSQAHFRNGTGSLSLAGTATAPKFSLSGTADLVLDPDGLHQNTITPIAVKISDLVYTSTQISSFQATPDQLDEPLIFKLGEANLTLPRAAVTYARKADNSGYTLSLAPGFGTIEMPDSEKLDITGKLILGGSFGSNNSISTAPSRAELEIINDTDFSVAGTEFTGTGGLKLIYQENADRKYGLLSLQGSNAINLEQFSDVKVTLGSSTFNPVTWLTDTTARSLATEWVSARGVGREP